jgi:spore maturation protein CgeB
VEALPGIPTIRVFEALACGIPLVSSPWRDVEGLFPAGSYLIAEDGQQMATALTRVLEDRQLAADLVRTGLAAIRERHTCAHRARELLNIIDLLEAPNAPRTKRVSHSDGISLS